MFPDTCISKNLDLSLSSFENTYLTAGRLKKKGQEEGEMKGGPGNYLVYVSGPEGSDRNITHAFEWNKGKGWSKTQKEGSTWYDGVDVDQALYPSDREGLLGHFGLWDWQEEFPWEKISSMSPKDLINARREKEKKDRHLEKHEAFRSGCTEQYLAEDFG